MYICVSHLLISQMVANFSLTFPFLLNFLQINSTFLIYTSSTSIAFSQSHLSILSKDDFLGLQDWLIVKFKGLLLAFILSGLSVSDITQDFRHENFSSIGFQRISTF